MRQSLCPRPVVKTEPMRLFIAPHLPVMIQHASPLKYCAPVPSAWQPFVVDNEYRFIATRESSSTENSITTRHKSGEVCLVKKYNVGRDVSVTVPATWRDLQTLLSARILQGLFAGTQVSISLHQSGGQA